MNKPQGVHNGLTRHETKPAEYSRASFGADAARSPNTTRTQLLWGKIFSPFPSNIFFAPSELNYLSYINKTRSLYLDDQHCCAPSCARHPSEIRETSNRYRRERSCYRRCNEQRRTGPALPLIPHCRPPPGPSAAITLKRPVGCSRTEGRTLAE